MSPRGILTFVHLKAIDFHEEMRAAIFFYSPPPLQKKHHQWPYTDLAALSFASLLPVAVAASVYNSSVCFSSWLKPQQQCVRVYTLLTWFFLFFLSVALQNSPPRNQLCERRKQHRTDLAKLTFDLYKNNPKDFIGCLNVKATLYGVYSVSYDLRCYAAKKMLKWVKEPAKSPRPSNIFMLLFWLCNTCLFFFTLRVSLWRLCWSLNSILILLEVKMDQV